MDDNNTLLKVLTNGPLEVSGNFRIVNSQGRIIENEGTVYLCRCGDSTNKPYCTDAHKHNGFSD